ncbi:putative LPS assembly protein LptD [Blattabacterium cuenoti]|uniref:putative LPS assembly protein LptD n=1 Tax=Blattabacterium cuenoti TaxID=1653831 RepID=UPI001EEB5478|nr:putative LPS assembly protein LptD [Blattabacterium cuenoti]
MEKIIFFYIFYSFIFCALSNEVKKEDNKQINNSFSFLNLKDTVKYKSNIQEHNVEEGKIYLKGNASIEYSDIKIQADSIEFNWKNGDLYATKKEKPIFLQQKNHQSIFSKVHINFNNKKGEFQDFYMQNKNNIIIADKIETNNNNITLKKVTYISDPFFIKGKDKNPDFYLKTDYVKFFNSKKYIFSGPVFLYWYKVPMPIFLPFLYIPIKEKLDAASYGILYPKVGIINKKIYMENIGLFFPISNFLNFKISSSIYNMEKWKLKTRIEYKLKYFYDGFLDFNYQIENNKKKDYQFHWKHNTDFKSDMGIDFNTDVNYNKNILNPIQNENKLLSYITLKKSFYNNFLFMNAYMIQKEYEKKMGIEFIIPEFIFYTSNRFFYNKKNLLLHNLVIDNKLSIHNYINFFKKRDFYTKFCHSINMDTFFYIFYPYFKIYPKVFYNEFYTWNFRKKDIYSFQQIDLSTDIISISLNKIFKIKKNIFLHQIEPILSLYTKYLSPILYDEEKNFYQKKINFTLNNNLYVKDTNDLNYKIIKDFKLVYSFFFDKNFIKWNELYFTGETYFTKDLEIKYKGGVQQKKEKNKNNMMYFDFSFSYNYDKIFLPIKNGYKKGKNRYDYFFFDDKGYAKYSIPLNFNFYLNSNYKNDLNKIKTFNTFIKVNGSINITKYWKINLETDYNIINNKIIFSNITFYRDLRSFQMSFNWSPETSSWSFFIGIKDPNLSKLIQYSETKNKI